MKEKYYYLRRPTSNGVHRCGVVFLILGDNIGARGISLCNEIDQFSKDDGINKAKGRAVKAIERKESSFEVCRQEAISKLPCSTIAFKSEFNPLFTDFELEILSDKKEKNEIPISPHRTMFRR